MDGQPLSCQTSQLREMWEVRQATSVVVWGNGLPSSRCKCLLLMHDMSATY